MDNTDDKKELRRVIKRYSNRKLYDTRDSRYVTLLQIAEMVRRGEDVQIIDNTTKEDKTEVTLALAISEELKAKPRSVPLGTLRNLIQERGEKILTSLRDGPIGRLIPEEEAPRDDEAKATDSAEQAGEAQQPPERDREKEKEKPERMTLAELVATSRHTLDQWQHAIDDRIHAVLPNLSLFLDIQSELRRVTQRVQALEQRLERHERASTHRPGEPAQHSESDSPTETQEGRTEQASQASQASSTDEDSRPKE